MRAGPVALIGTLVALLAVAGWYAYQGLVVPGEPMPREGYIALVVGVVFSIVIGAGLMALLFYSSRRGFDEPPRLRDDD